MSENKVKRIKQTVNIPVRDLHPHPKNPRKNLGDLEELTESIKKNGIMQNLTVIPGFYRANGEWFNTEAEYTVIIGHRRLEAARLCSGRINTSGSVTRMRSGKTESRHIMAS